MSPFVGRRWARSRCSSSDLQLARGLLEGRLSFLGFEPANIGVPPKWRQDLYSGWEWPAEPVGRIPVLRSDGSDIRTVWELSRGYHFIPLAKAYRRTSDSSLLELFRVHIESWLSQNPPGLGPNWWSPMDVAIRCANWILAFILLADAPLPSEFWARVLANLRLSGWYVERHLEWHPRWRGNHYLANGVGLVYLGTLFRDDDDGRRWLRLGARILRQEMAFQVHRDGVSFEAALGYHRLVTEFFTYAGELVRLNLPGALPAAYWDSLRRMYGFVSDYLPESGEAPMLGDADDGRLHAFCAEALGCPRLHRAGLRPRYAPRRSEQSRAYPEGGFYVLRGRSGHAIIRCGPVGLRGAGSHDHNDQLSLELVVRGVRLIADSGTYTYTRDLAERYAFRATAAHSVLQLGGEEQNPIAVHRPWRVLADRTKSECVAWEVGEDIVHFSGRHLGYHHRPTRTVCSRTITAVFSRGDWRIEDTIEGVGDESLIWRMHLVPGTIQVSAQPGEWSIRHSAAPDVAITLQTSVPLSFSLGRSRMSDRYGQVMERPVLLLEGEVRLPARIICRFLDASRSPGAPIPRSSPPDR